MKKINRAVIIVSKIIEVFMWVGCGLSAVLTVLSALRRGDLFRFFTDAAAGDPLLTSGSFSLRALDAAGGTAYAAFVIFFLTTAITFALMAMIARNVHLIFKTAEGRTSFSKGATPFQPDNVRMVREIGVFAIAIQAVQLVMSVIARIVLGSGAVESGIGMQGVFFGLVMLALSRFFAYGMQLEADVDGLL